MGTMPEVSGFSVVFSASPASIVVSSAGLGGGLVEPVAGEEGWAEAVEGRDWARAAWNSKAAAALLASGSKDDIALVAARSGCVGAQISCSNRRSQWVEDTLEWK